MAPSVLGTASAGLSNAEISIPGSAYSYNESSKVFRSAQHSSAPNQKRRERMLSLNGTVSSSEHLSNSNSNSSSSNNNIKSERRPLSIGVQTMEVLALTPSLLLGALLLDAASVATELPTSRRIAGLARLRRSIEAAVEAEAEEEAADELRLVASSVPMPVNPVPMPHSRDSQRDVSASAAAVGNDFARVEPLSLSTVNTQQQQSASSDNSSNSAHSIPKQQHQTDFVRFFNTILDEGVTSHPDLDLDFGASDMQDTHFHRRFFAPMRGSTPTQIIIMDDTGLPTGFAAGLAVYLAGIVRAPNKSNMVYYLRGGVEGLQKECPWMFQSARIQLPPDLVSPESSTPETNLNESTTIDSESDAFVGWGDEPIEQAPLLSSNRQDSAVSLAGSGSNNVEASSSLSSDDTGSVATIGNVDDMDLDEDEVMEGVSIANDDAIVEIATTVASCETAVDEDSLSSTLSASTVSPPRKASTSNTSPNYKHHHHHHSKLSPFHHNRRLHIAKHPQAHFPHLAKTNSPTHDLRNLQHHLVAAVWYGKRVPIGDVAVTISHPSCSATTPSSTIKSTPAIPLPSFTRATSTNHFLHLSSCYAAADARELRAKKIRHIVRLGWGFDAFSSGLHMGGGSNGSTHYGGGGSANEEGDMDGGEWSEWDDEEHDKDDDDDEGDERKKGGAMSGVEGSVKFFQSLASGVGCVSELGKMIDGVWKSAGEGCEGGDGGQVFVGGKEERRKLRELMGGTAKRVGVPGVAFKRRSWRVKMYDFPIEDTPVAPIRWIFEKCCEVIEAARLLGENVLIHCHAGVSRSSTIVLAYLMRFQRLTLYEAWLLTYKARPIIRPNEGFARALQELEREIHPHLTETTLPIFWMSDSYANFMEFLEFRERGHRAGLLPLAIAAEDVMGEDSGVVGNVIGGLVGEDEVVDEREGNQMRKGRSRGLSLSGRV